MKNNLWSYIKVINGIYLIAIYVWMLYFISSEVDERTLVIVSFFVFSTQIVILLCSLIFYFLTKGILTIKEQIKYGLIILLAILDICYLINGFNGDKSFLIFIALINILPILYFLKDNIQKKSSIIYGANK